MNKKTVAMVTSLAVGGTLLFGTAFADVSQPSGYEAFKSAILQTKDLKDGTADVKVSLTDNGTELINASSNVKINMNSKAMSSVTTVNSSGVASTFASYTQDGKNIAKTSQSDVYTVREGRKNDFNKEEKAANLQVVKSVEAVVDALVGNMKDGFTVDNGKTSIKLNEGQISPLVNAVASLAITAGNNERMHKDAADAKEINLKNVMPKLQSDIKIADVEVTGDINSDNTFKDQDATITITGKDAQGADHNVVIHATVNLSNINSTTPDTVDLTGKQVKTVTGHFRGEDK